MLSPVGHLSLIRDGSVQALLSLEEEAALRAAVNALEVEEAALVVGQAPTIEDKSRLVWALTPERRAEVLDTLHPGFVGALIQNREAENKALLGDLSREQFSRLLRFCSPERAYYWIALAASFENARANMLALLVPLSDLAAALLTKHEFENHCRAISDYGVDNLDLDEFPDIAFALTVGAEAAKLQPSLNLGQKELASAVLTLFGEDGVLKTFPLRDPGLRRICQTILAYDPERYAALIHTAVEIADYRDNHGEERAVVSEDPILLDSLLTLQEERARVGLTPEAVTERPVERPRAADVQSVPSLPARRSAALMRTAAAGLPAERQGELSQEMQLLMLQEAAYAGGSFKQEDLEHVAGRVQTYVQLGLAGLSEGDAAQASRLLSEQRLRTLMESGARQVERLRQVALRLLPWREILDRRHVRLLESLEHPDIGVDLHERPVLRIPPDTQAPKKDRKPEAVELDALREELETISGWVALVRAVGRARIETRLSRYRDTASLTRALAVSAILYRFWDPLLVEAGDLKRFRETYLDPATGRFNQAAYQALAEAIRSLAAERKLDASAVQEIARFLARSLDELAGGAEIHHGDTSQKTGANKDTQD